MKAAIVYLLFGAQLAFGLIWAMREDPLFLWLMLASALVNLILVWVFGFIDPPTLSEPRYTPVGTLLYEAVVYCHWFVHDADSTIAFFRDAAGEPGDECLSISVRGREARAQIQNTPIELSKDDHERLVPAIQAALAKARVEAKARGGRETFDRVRRVVKGG